MSAAFNYDTFVTRNTGYVDATTQSKIRETRLLIAGCGLGASTAIAATRMGFQHFVLIDGDTVDAHNLNRQFYDFDDIGTPKVQALKKHILRINPQAQVEAVQANLDQTNAVALVTQVDIIFDTIDFLDLEAILALHTTAQAQGKGVFTALSIGFGAGVLYFPADSKASLAQIIQNDIALASSEGDASYAAVFGKIMGRIGAHLDRQVVEQVAKALTIMEDGRPCPASQISVGSFTVAALAVSMMHDLLAGMPVPASPQMVAHSFRNHVTKLIDISK
ncbi:ThiF family adenylyltransferase [Massilia sp. CF038]|uniref:ThiF family adenylyltransferase n=1 Tax=Massilia sp. CF038 TaxID=1881045 RepID=UPI00091F9DD5|nr:ThiF family adenylyltransferase [Massilia sp. CF038]SHH41276.1 Molybdopterin or thiamine biosynthesis adenylyltransferase [Massilia sp. CF038]